MSELTSEELSGQLELARQRFEQVIEQIRTVLVSDAGRFVSKSGKAAFLEQPAVSDELSDARLAELKARSNALGEALSKRLGASLAKADCWRTGPSSTSDDRSLQEVSEVWSELQKVGTETREFLGEFGFDSVDISYVPPKYFVGGLYLPTLVEHYWRLRHEMGTLDAQRADLEAQSTRQRLQARWDGV